MTDDIDALWIDHERGGARHKSAVIVALAKSIRQLAALAVDLLIGIRMHEGARIAREWGKALGIDLQDASKAAEARLKATGERRSGPVKVARVKPQEKPEAEAKAKATKRKAGKRS